MKRLLIPSWTVVALAALACALSMVACGGSGADDSTPGDPPRADAIGLDRFLLFPNAQVKPDGAPPAIDSPEYARAYYAAVDACARRTSLPAWRAANGFDSGSGTQITVVFGDRRDLGYGRRMTGRISADGSRVAFMVENYLVNPGGEYGDLMLSTEAAVVRDTRWLVGVNAIEWGPELLDDRAPCNATGAVAASEPFARFFNFNAATGAREETVDLDGRGRKAMPGVCIACHGGRGDGLVRVDGAARLPTLLPESPLAAPRGDVQAQLQPFQVDTFAFVDRPGWRRQDQEAALKQLNRIVLCTYAVDEDDTAGSFEPCVRPSVRRSAWYGGGAQALIRSAYGGDALPNAVYDDRHVPEGWAANAALYRDVIAPSCRGCHLLRGRSSMRSIQFDRYEDFTRRAEAIADHVFARGDMPLARIVYQDFWQSSAPQALADALDALGHGPARDTAGRVLPPGRPLAVVEPDRIVQRGEPHTLSAEQSLYGAGFAWTVIEAPAGPSAFTLTGETTATPLFTPNLDGLFRLRVVASRGSEPGEPKELRILASAAAPAVTWPDVRTTLNGICVSCHQRDLTPFDHGVPMSFKTDDFPGQDRALYDTVRSRINFGNPRASLLLRKPTGDNHGASPSALTGYDASKALGDPERADLDQLVRWIAAGAPYE